MFSVQRQFSKKRYVSIFTLWDFGPSGVRTLPLAAGINEGGHYFRYIILFGPSVLRAPAEQTKVATIFVTKL